MIQRAIVLQHADVLTSDDIELPKLSDRKPGEAELFRLEKSLAIEQFERDYIARLLAEQKGNISQAAKAAGKDRRSFQRLVNKHGFDRKSFKRTI